MPTVRNLQEHKLGGRWVDCEPSHDESREKDEDTSTFLETRLSGCTHPCNVTPGGSDLVDVQTDTASRLGDEGALLEGVVDALDAVVAHGQQETTTKKKPNKLKAYKIENRTHSDQDVPTFLMCFKDKYVYLLTLERPQITLH